jgi:hypothetical protein
MKIPGFLTPEVIARMRMFTLICNLLTIAISCYTLQLNRRNRQQIKELNQACDRISKQLRGLEK